MPGFCARYLENPRVLDFTSITRVATPGSCAADQPAGASFGRRLAFEVQDGKTEKQ
jgi:hypothetical protein